MKQNTLFIIAIVIAIILLAVGIFAKNWIFYLLTACLVFVISMLGSRKNKRK